MLFRGERLFTRRPSSRQIFRLGLVAKHFDEEIFGDEEH